MASHTAHQRHAGGLAGRTIQVVADMTPDEQLYLYERARRLKAHHSSIANDLAAPPLCVVDDDDVLEKVNTPDSTVYLLFMEGSTRTRESLRNAAVFHGVKVNEFQAATSSFQKNETITDTMKMLSVYSTDRSVFVIRSPIEGVCRWLETVLPKHADRFGIPRPAFVNAGDGRYSHPLGELVDTFSILEHLKWNRSSLHIALIGDLVHGRTAHSKVDGLRIFNSVRVDLVAPASFAYPVEYRTRMQSSGFQVRVFESLEEYLERAASSLAQVWYFYKPQFERCGDLAQDHISMLRSKVTFRLEWQPQLPPGMCFFQTLPRDKEHPIVPLALDSSPLNRWDRVANNAYFLHIVLLGLLFGQVGRGLPAHGAPDTDGEEAVASRGGSSPLARVPAGGGAPLPRFMELVDISSQRHERQPERARPGGAVPIKDGLVVDHIGCSSDTASCWRRLRMVRTILGWSRHIGSEGVYSSSGRPGQMKGIISMPNFNFETVTIPQLKVLASIAPGCTVNAVSASMVVGKYRLHVPERIYNLPNIHCKNILCVSHPQNKQRDVVAFFERVPFYETSALPDCRHGDYLFVCKYCRWPHQYEGIWADSKAHYTVQQY
eukprot:CAMPEP_0179025330 /NCGR_PEP_ID=MMETSP0796-20121207/7924_1 /TAXON_ID=73915 /ORGANISM="Pyrodinium bahamense, Strain pbaha01" /LENGTH=604 /DNA_ID=CAMNT_0020721337 /DNA_START=92 /DNA_END=1906 /DNA_ORIENTATION=+